MQAQPEHHSHYFEEVFSLGDAGFSLKEKLAVIAGRYMGQNPPEPFHFRLFPSDSFLPDHQGWYSLDLNIKLPRAQNGHYACIAAVFKKNTEETQTLSLRCYGKTTLLLNGETIWKSGTWDENDSRRKAEIPLPCKTGWNTLLLTCQKTPAGFGCALGCEPPQWNWISFLAPFADRRGQGGFAYSEAFTDLSKPWQEIDLRGDEGETGLVWYPQQEGLHDPWDFGNVYGIDAEWWACGWTTVCQHRPGTWQVDIACGGAECFLMGQPVSQQVALPCGEHDVLLVSHCPGDGSPWKSRLSFTYADGERLELPAPKNVQGVRNPVLYLGPFREHPAITAPDLYTLYHDGEGGENRYWEAGRAARVRPCLENELFGRWNYPLGVTLYGLTETARMLGRADIEAYVGKHIGACVSMDEYSRWDMQTYGFPEINIQLALMASLDDCGSFGSAMLSFYRGRETAQVRCIADRIAAYISAGQSRLPDGALCRREGDYGTLWVDDLYMSVPFLCRYARLSGEERYLEDAAAQVLLYKAYLFLPDQSIMSHVYNLQHQSATKVPWGRGNGWCLFSLSQLLEALPQNHPKWQELLRFFVQLCKGYLALQGERGLWRQVLNVQDAYEEASCTAMFTYAFCKAVRFGWVDAPLTQQLAQAAQKAWEGLCRYAIDRFGNVYGICRGSSYSFTPEYYCEELGWKLNDPHGTGIVLLAGIEMEKMLRPEVSLIAREREHG